MTEPHTGRMFWIAYSENMDDVAVFWIEVECLRYAITRGWSVRRAKWNGSLREQLFGDLVDAEIDEQPDPLGAT